MSLEDIRSSIIAIPLPFQRARRDCKTLPDPTGALFSLHINKVYCVPPKKANKVCSRSAQMLNCFSKLSEGPTQLRRFLGGSPGQREL